MRNLLSAKGPAKMVSDVHWIDLIKSQYLNFIVSNSKSDSDFEEESTNSTNSDVSMENHLPPRHTSPSEENPGQHDIHSNDGDNDSIMMDVQPISSSRHTSSPKSRSNIMFLCNPNDEDPGLRQESVSELVGNNLSSVHKRSWAKDSTCECVHLTIKPV